MPLAVPTSIDAIDAAWVEGLLRGAGLAIPGRVAQVAVSRIGTELGFLSVTARVAITYDGGAGDGPASLVVKLEPTAERYRTAERGIAAFAREIRFYQEIAPRVALRLPRIFHTAATPEASALAMEDLSDLRHVDQLHGMRQSDVMATVREIAKLHAAYWSRAGESSLEWMPAYDHFWEEGYAEHWPAFARTYELRIGRAGVQLGERLGGAIGLMARLRRRPATVIHADLRADNLLFAGDDAVILDWQLATRSLALIDVARVLGGSEPPAERRGHQLEVFAAWHESLLDAGVRNYSFEEALDDLRLAALYTLLIPIRSFGLTPADAGARTARLVDCQAERIFASAVELDAADALPN